MMNFITSVIVACVAAMWIIPMAEGDCDLIACTVPPASMNSTSNDTSAFCAQQNAYYRCLRDESSSCSLFAKIIFDVAITAVKTVIENLDNCELTSGASMTTSSVALYMVFVAISLSLWH
ncbi:uncharacterized protein LOC124279733 [Haliotis rubra]|uniref:uncharacterized protein LOC124279733 n=1 Tax=Haliotis rubra TaxID=36100 RepID=UPI001EE55B91|nr:uncharacterized protein LOC124279733 [Haliotis rubra]